MILHTPVLLHEVCSFLRPESKLIVDCTLGHAGHAMALLILAKEARLVGFDVDELMLKKAKLRIENGELKIEDFPPSRIKGKEKDLEKEENLEIKIKSSGASHHPSFQTKEEHDIEYIHGNYSEIKNVLKERKADFILNDLGVNLEHFKAVERGFSIR